MSSVNNLRPTSHFSPPHSWSNDPCGAVYVPETREYILCYQWNPGTTDGGNCAWGMAKSKDLITWSDCMPALCNGVDTEYDSYGVFSGSIVSKLVDGIRVLYLFYTSVSALPIHWSKRYIKGCESQSVAISTDYGKSWQRYQHNPILANPPTLDRTTGWRDPFVSKWKSLSELRKAPLSTSYMLLASGEKSQGPRLLLYESEDLLNWQPLSTLFKGRIDAEIGPKSQLRFGRNFECASFFTLGNTDYIIVGVEEDPSLTDRHSSRYTLWMSGFLRLDMGGKPEFIITSFGRLDHGILYAPHIFRGADGEILQLGWADEDKNGLVREQGWAGCLAVPRELHQVRVPIPRSGVVDEMWDIDDNSNTMMTLGVKPACQVKKLRARSRHYHLENLSAIRSKTFEISANFTCLSGNENLIFNVRQAPHDREVTRIIIALSNKTITIDRSASSLTNGNKASDAGSFELLNYGTAQKHAFEDLRINIFVDGSIIEVYANDRFALTSRVYPSLDSAMGVSCDFRNVHGKKNRESLHVGLDCWEGLADAWPSRHGRDRGVDVTKEEKRDTEVKTVDLHLQATAA
jgi:beta-fructofuranosidase